MNSLYLATTKALECRTSGRQNVRSQVETKGAPNPYIFKSDERLFVS